MIYAIRGILALLGYVINTLFWSIPIFLGALLKLIPIKPLRIWLSAFLDLCATAWIGVNTLNQRLFSRTRLVVSGLDKLSPKEWYLVIANHQSWVDILMLQRIFNRKVPFLKFFLKKELIYVPVMGLAWWALDFPFMQRYKKAFLEKNPHLKGKDLETTRKACEKFRYIPVSIMNFVEGTRFTPGKHDKQQSPFTHLLKPKAGGVAFVLSSMGSQLHKLLDVTIAYPQGVPSFWDFICGKVKQVKIDVRVLPISQKLTGNYFDDPEQREKFQGWLNQIWLEKDNKLKHMLAAN